MSNPTNALAIREFLQSPVVEKMLIRVLPKGLTPARMIRQAMTLLQLNPGLAECTQKSILGGIVRAAELGLELSPSLGQAWLVPRYNKHIRAKEAVFQIGYRGYLQLVYRSNRVACLQAAMVRELDSFRMRRGTSPCLEHEPVISGDPGRTLGYYAVAILDSGMPDFEYMTYEEMLAYKAKYAASDGDSSPWVTAFDSMGLKTVLKRLSKRLPMSVEDRRRLEADEDILDVPAASQPVSLPAPSEEAVQEITSEELEQAIAGELETTEGE